MVCLQVVLAGCCLAAALGLAGCRGSSVGIAEEGSVEDLQATIAILSRQISDLEAENTRLKRSVNHLRRELALAPLPEDDSGSRAQPTDSGTSAPAPRSAAEPRPAAVESPLEVLSIRGRATERSGRFWRWSWVLIVRNGSSATIDFDATIHFVDRDGITVRSEVAYGLTVGAASDATFDGSTLVEVPGALKVESFTADLSPR